MALDKGHRDVSEMKGQMWPPQRMLYHPEGNQQLLGDPMSFVLSCAG